jgi:hypothetical protein
MKHIAVSELSTIADVHPPKAGMSRRERLERWAECLERNPDAELRTLHGIEYGPREQRLAARTDNSPLTVAYSDPVLREEGLASDKLGDALSFFDISERDAHRVFCSCLYGAKMHAGEVALRVRRMANPRAGLLPLALGAVVVAGAIPMLAFVLG